MLNSETSEPSSKENLENLGLRFVRSNLPSIENPDHQRRRNRDEGARRLLHLFRYQSSSPRRVGPAEGSSSRFSASSSRIDGSDTSRLVSTIAPHLRSSALPLRTRSHASLAMAMRRALARIGAPLSRERAAHPALARARGWFASDAAAGTAGEASSSSSSTSDAGVRSRGVSFVEPDGDAPPPPAPRRALGDARRLGGGRRGGGADADDRGGGRRSQGGRARQVHGDGGHRGPTGNRP